MIQNCSLKGYELAREVLYLPSTSCLDECFANENKFYRESIQNIETVQRLIQNYKSIFKIDEPLDCILSVDAASLDRPNKYSHSFVFAFNVQPIDYNYKCFPIHILSKKSQNANEDIINVIYRLSDILKQEGINIISVATDGDEGYDFKADETFSKYITEFEQNGFLGAIEKVEKLKEIFWISDLLHLVKLARKYIIKGNVTVKNVLTKTFNRITLENDLNLGLPLTDVSSISYMQDFYPLKIFDINNLMKLYQNEKYDEYLYFLPFCLWLESITSPNLKKSTRLFFLKTSFTIFYYFYYQHAYTKFEKGITVYISKHSRGQFLNQTFIKRCMNTIILSYCIIKNYDNVRLNRIGSHPIENFFGQVRGFCRNFDDYDNFVRCSLKAFENIILRNKYNIKQVVKKRINVAGEKINNEYGTIEYDSEICSEFNVLQNILNDLNINQFSSEKCDKYSYSKFIEFIESLVPEEDQNPKAKRPKITSGTAIKTRCCNCYYESQFQISDVAKIIGKNKNKQTKDRKKISDLISQETFDWMREVVASYNSTPPPLYEPEIPKKKTSIDSDEKIVILPFSNEL